MATLFQHNNGSAEIFATKFRENQMAAQQFTVSIAHSIEYVILKMYKAGSPGNVIVEIQEVDENNQPNGTVLCSGTIDANTFTDRTISTEGDWHQIDFSIPVDLQANTMYAIAVHIEDWGGDVSNAAYWIVYDPSTYSEGYGLRSSDQGATWSDDINEDYLFEEWGTSPTSVGALPTIDPSLQTLWGF